MFCDTLSEELFSVYILVAVLSRFGVFKEEISSIDDWSVDSISAAINSTKEKAEKKKKMLYMPIRIFVSGQMHGPELPDTIYLLGKDVVLDRLRKGLN